MSIIAVDPGTSNTGIVYMDERRVICVKTITHKTTIKTDQDELRYRARSIAMQLADFAADKPHEAIVMEGFMTYTGRTGGYTFQTPYLCGYLHAVFDDENIVIQTSRQVLNPKTRGNVKHLLDMAALGYEVYGDSKVCTNEHLRSALMHGIYYYQNKAKNERMRERI